MTPKAFALPGSSSRSPSPPAAAPPPLNAEEKKPDSLLLHVRKTLGPYCRQIVHNRYFQLAMFVALLLALFLPDLWVIADRPHNDDLDVLLTLVGVLFIFELLVQSVGMPKSYLYSFFFWMDLLGAASLLLDLSYITQSDQQVGGDTVSNNVIIMRAARVAKLGARAGRFTKLAKLLRFLPGMGNVDDGAGTAKLISSKLITALSTRTSCLIILLVMIMPLFNLWAYPEEDWSPSSFVDIMETTYSRAPSRFKLQLAEVTSFYEDKSYFPWRVRAKDESNVDPEVADALPWLSPREAPSRMSNTVVFTGGRLIVEFNFMSPNQLDAWMNVVLLLVVMVLMIAFSLILSQSVSSIVLKPLEQLLTQVRQMANTIFRSVTDMEVVMKEDARDDRSDQEDSTEDSSNFGNETQLLAKVVQKLAVISEITMNKPVLDAQTLQNLAEGDRAVISGFQGTATHDTEFFDHGEEMENVLDMEAIELAQRAMMENAGLSMELLDSWNLNPLELDKARNHVAAMYFCSSHNHGVEFDSVVMGNFLSDAEAGYVKSSPYHNWFHAVDCTHAVYRLLLMSAADTFLTFQERYALLVSAVCHDIGHPGLNNGFLVETSHELALRYNDKSPLENMHCSKMFELVGQARCNIFSTLSKLQYYEVRKVCIEAILHTDNAQHFTMVKDVQMLYEVNAELWDASRQLFLQEEELCLAQEAVDTLKLPESRKLIVNLILHTADISNSMKPFRISRIWAWQVLEEFFMQGDAEARLGVPVQALNDRNTVNRPFSQVGFIEFLVSPLIFAALRILPQTEHLAVQMLMNARSWQKQWENEGKTPPSDNDKKLLNERILKMENKFRSCQLGKTPERT
ncbi:unnamed protein product [Effrenium voratum]|uniref:Phosphodiesterase n=1 Tax=Effrenium voratum TaxID=2562239 RepID=A0AA36HN32_9DINO|nr:unnamed protein product [Effrenium voratum]CAJ1372199.1 unnamed protein product [Effrenium voratum]CAJ1439752.1 unnamed protein product [Effrenium voratum]